MSTLYRAVYDFVEVEKGEVVLKAGDVVLFIKQIDNDWFYGENVSRQEEGLMPRNFVQPCQLPKVKQVVSNFMDRLHLTISPYESIYSEDLNFDISKKCDFSNLLSFFHAKPNFVHIFMV